MTNVELSIAFFLQLAIILLACRAVGALVRRVGQPLVIGEMLTGILLGPSLLGLLMPEAMTSVFPKPSMPVIYTFAQTALVLYMFTVGLEFRVDYFRQRARSAIVVSTCGIVAPFVLGGGLALWLRGRPGLFPESVSPTTAALFLGAAIAITALPVLARILSERRLTGTRIGTLALAAGAVGDALAWCIFACVLATFQASAWPAVKAIGGGLIFAGVAWAGLRPLLRPLGREAQQRGGVGGGTFVGFIALLMSAAWFTDWVGIHAVFGAFVLGVVVPRGPLADDLRRKIEPLTANLLLPLFFVYSGLNTRIGLVDTPALWGLTLAILVVACLGKGVACCAAARLSGETPRDAIAIGALMNARGLMELIILNIGLERGLIGPTLFSMMVMMAILTTLLATPVFELAYRGPRSGDPPLAPLVTSAPKT